MFVKKPCERRDPDSYEFKEREDLTEENTLSHAYTYNHTGNK